MTRRGWAGVGVYWGVRAALVLAAGYVVVGAAFCAATLHVGRCVGPAPRGAVTVSISAADDARLDAWWMRPARSTA